ncbi:LADA_0G14092g1_1 [Lachancea dasiensis]|uniref:LADA_0G14092g1_1 n=1 Tax=Lachancea dasiensis TaxID=1072105 RepID=A0A1G4JW17_9SACH|nr:LADA_0G14092g1_1 [Lachancea dasiensis]
MLQLITSPAIFVTSTIIPLQITIEHLNLGGNGPDSFSMYVFLLKYWCLYTMIRSIPNPLVYLFQSLPLSNVVELGAWVVLVCEILGRFNLLEISRGYGISTHTKPASTARTGWMSYFQSLTTPPLTDRYVFGQLTIMNLRFVENWPFKLQILDSSFKGSIGWILRFQGTPLKNQESADTRSWKWGYQWLAGQAIQKAVGGEEEYDLLDDVIQDIKKS